MKRLFLLLAILAFPALSWAQQTPITATVIDPNGNAWAGATGRATIQCPGNQAPLYNGYSVPRTYTIVGLDSFGTFSLILYDVNTLTPLGCSYQFSLVYTDGITQFTTPDIGGSASATPITGTGTVNLSTIISSYSPLLPQSGGSKIGLFTNGVLNSSQNRLNLTQGSGITITSGANGLVTFTNTGTGSALLSLNNIWTGINDFHNVLTTAGPDPIYDVTSGVYGARAVFSPPSTTASCNGTTTLTVTSSTGFQAPAAAGNLGDGVTVWGCGANVTATMPGTASAPTVISGIAQTFQVPDATLVSLTAASTYSYVVVPIDQHGGIQLPSPTTTVTNGLAALGMVASPLSVTSASLSGTTLTLTLPATNSLAANELIHFTGGNPAILSGDYLISSVAAGGETIVINNISVTTTSSTPITSTGGTIAYGAGMQITWTGVSGAWEYGICAHRPADGALHLIGLSLPSGAAGYTSSTTFTDWGATITSLPLLPAYLSDAICTAGSVTNDYLTTTITSIPDSTHIVVANSASQTASGKTLLFDDEPGFAAAAAATTDSYKGVLYIPESNAGYFYLNSRWDTVSLGPGFSIRQEEVVFANETIATRAYWYGSTAAGSLNQFQAASTPIIGCNGAWPCAYDPYEVPFWENLTFNLQSGNQGLVLLFDGNAGPIQGGYLHSVNVSSVSSSDYSSLNIVVRPGPYNSTFDNMSVLSGPGNGGSNIDKTWAPSVYFSGDASASPFSIVDWEIRDWQGSARAIYSKPYGGTTEVNIATHVYWQGALTPVLTIQNMNGVAGVLLRASEFTNDTSSTALVADLGHGGVNTALYLSATGMLTPSAEAHGIAPWVTGNYLTSGTLVNTPALSSGTFLNSQPTFPTPTNPGDLAYYNGYFWTNFAGNTSGAQLLQESSSGVPSWFSLASPGTIGGTTPGVGNFSQVNLPESTAPSGVSATDVLYGISASHQIGVKLNNGSQLYLTTTDGSGVGGHCAEFTTAYEIIDNGSACGSGGGSGTVTSFACTSVALSPLFDCSVATPSTTPVLTFSLLTAAAHKVYMNNTGSTASPGFQSIGEADLPATTLFTDVARSLVAALTVGTGGSIAASGTGSINATQLLGNTWAIPAAIGTTTPAAGHFTSLDATNGITALSDSVHAGYSNWVGNTANYPLVSNTVGIMGPTVASFTAYALQLPSTAPTVGQTITFGTPVSGIIPITYTAPSGATLQTNTVNNTSQTTLNIRNTTGGGANAINVTNPSAGNVEATIANSGGGGNAVLDCTLTGASQGQTLTFDSTPKCVNAFSATVPNPQTGTTYAVASTDRNGLIICNETSANLAISLASSASFGSNFGFAVVNQGTYPCTITPATSTINGTSTWTFLPGQQGNVVSDNTNYFATRSGYASGTTGSIGGAIVGVGCDTGTVTIQGATTSMVPWTVASTSGAPGAGLTASAQVTSANTVTVSVCAPLSLTPTSSTYLVRLSQ